MIDNKKSSAQKVINECFWGDYHLSVQELLSSLESGDQYFQRFIFSKIIENSRHPSLHLRILFTTEQLQSLLKLYMGQAEAPNKRIRLVAANLTGNFDLAREYAWRT